MVWIVWILGVLVFVAAAFLVLALVANPVDVALPTSAKALIIISGVIVVIIGIDRGHLYRIERGHRCPSPEVAERIAELYRLPIAVTDRLMTAAALTRAYGRIIGVR